MTQHQFFAFINLISCWGSIYLTTIATSPAFAFIGILLTVFYSIRTGICLRRYRATLQ